jgi:hypothetical protein
VSDRDLVLDAIEEAQRILAEHIEPGFTAESRGHDQHASVSIGPARAAVRRLRAGYGLGVVK